MNVKFNAQMTTADTFRQTEHELYDQFVEFGYDDALARAIAHAFTQFMLGYMPAHQIASVLMKAGASDALAAALAGAFVESKSRATGRESYPRTSEPHAVMR